jgi:hypothetical protein
VDRGGPSAFIRGVYLRARNALRRRSGCARLGFHADPGVDLDEILCAQEERKVGDANCASFWKLRCGTLNLGGRVGAIRHLEPSRLDGLRPILPRTPPHRV